MHAKSSKRKPGSKAATLLGATGLSLSLASGVSAATSAVPATGMLLRHTGLSHEITLHEEELSDVSLATFHVFDNENPGTFRHLKLAAGGGGCGCGGAGPIDYPPPVSNYASTPQYSSQPARIYAQAPRRIYAQAPKRRHVPK